jgi:GNAT superfamily N-acetyltransferase
MKVRELNINDYPAMYRLNLQLGYSYSEALTRKNIERILSEKKDKIFIVENQNKNIIAYVHITPYVLSYHDPMMIILALVVDKDFRRQGVGALLMHEAEKYAETMGYKGIRLNSGFDRNDAHDFYEKCGYINRKNQKNYIKIF